MEQGSVLRRKESAQKTQEKLSLNPFGTGQCLTTAKDKQMSNREESLNPFGTGQCLTTQREKALIYSLSQSLWNRAVSYDLELSDKQRKGQLSQSLWNRAVSYDEITRTNGSASRKSQSLWNRAVSYDDGSVSTIGIQIGLNPFGTGQCLTTAVGSSSLVRQGLPKPLPNFFRDSESWVLIWLNFEQVLTFHLHIKRSKT